MKDLQDKGQMRRLILKQRRSLSQKVWQEKSYLVCDRLESLSLFQKSRTILAYFSFKQELDLSSLFNKGQRNWGFPRCVGSSLHWHCWQPQDKLILNSYGIQEPHPQAPKISPATVDLILVPAVAIDRFGYRLGYGGGFYDRFLNSPEWVEKPTVGIVFHDAYLPQLPRDPWDRKLHYICTEFICHRTRTDRGLE